MILFGIFNILYENERNDDISFHLICYILFFLYGLILINETNIAHYIFATYVFILIILFMLRHCYLKKNNLLFLLLFLSLSSLFLILKNIKGKIIYYQCFYLVNFAIFYSYLHLLD